MTSAARLVALLEGLEQEGTSVVELACGGAAPEAWRLYPGEYGVFDRRTKSQAYFHSHGPDCEEVGHFHTARLFADRTAHLVAISMAPTGWPRALFTVNLWAIGDAWEPAEQLKRYVRHFRIDESRGDPRVVRFVNLVFEAYRSEIEALQDAKAEALTAHRLARPGVDVFADRALEVTSLVEIDARVRLAAPG
ncbi:MAG TPA: hypothetical protein VFX28_12940 [Methylomirabilota bacterium]|nr:hypothetical protein [Methylomirabilota bacterium]